MDGKPAGELPAAVAGPTHVSSGETGTACRWMVRERLRRHTRRLHAQINAHPLVSGITEAGFGLNSYRRLLLAYERFYRQAEPRIADSLACFGLPLWYEDRRRQPWLAADLRHFGLHPEALSGLEEDFRVSLASPGRVVGALYAIEGSSLGGAFIARSLARNLGLSADAGARFFHGYGAATDIRWQEFCRFAERIGDHPVELHRAEQAAAQVFEAFRDLLDRCQALGDA